MSHLNRCKTSNLAGGAGGTDETGTNEDTHQLPAGDIDGDAHRRTCSIFHINFLQWEVANPKTTLPFGRSRVGSDGTIASSKDVERIPLHCFSRLVIHHFLSGLTEVFLHVRCVPHHKFAKMFLSKCVSHAGFVKVA